MIQVCCLCSFYAGKFASKDYKQQIVVEHVTLNLISGQLCFKDRILVGENVGVSPCL